VCEVCSMDQLLGTLQTWLDWYHCNFGVPQTRELQQPSQWVSYILYNQSNVNFLRSGLWGTSWKRNWLHYTVHKWVVCGYWHGKLCNWSFSASPSMNTLNGTVSPVKCFLHINIILQVIWKNIYCLRWQMVWW
jgi:hypothetical protein